MRRELFGAKEYFPFEFLRSEHTSIEELLLAVDIAYQASDPDNAFDMEKVAWPSADR